MKDLASFLEESKHIFQQVALENPWYKVVGIFLGSAINWTFGTEKEILIIVPILIIFDTITGLIKHAKNGSISSRGFFRFSTKCFIYFLLIVTGRLIDKVVPVMFASAIIESFIAVTEALSIMENLSQAGFPVPNALVKKLQVFKDKGADGLKQETKEDGDI